MKSLRDAIRLRSRLIKNLEEGDSECACDDGSRLLTVVVVGGGFAGVETITSVNDFVREAIEFYPKFMDVSTRDVLRIENPIVIETPAESVEVVAA